MIIINVLPFKISVLKIHTEEDYVSAIMGDLSKRNSSILGIDSQYKTRIVRAMTPLSEMVGYSTSLRTLTSGCASFTMELSHYEPLSPPEQEKVIRKVKGFVPQFQNL